MQAGAQAKPDTAAYVSGRYRVDAELGRGGMGAVYAVHDASSGLRLALKRLDAQASSRQRAAFEREYYTLAGLKHPSIVRVHDYGTDAQGLFYTMELLEGQDLGRAAPMPWPEVCRCLRDTASILAVLHTRRLLHRDVAPRNLWRTSEGRIKLIDFGALAPFGVCREIVGTPPFVPPEALLGRPLDQRSDLYALGALGYWLLTGVHAYPARSLGDLRELWRHVPSAPSRVLSQFRPELADVAGGVPAELDQLILSLLQDNPALRLTSAVELIERVSVIAGLEPEPADVAIESTLQSKAFVGRKAELERVKTELQNARKKKSGVCIVFEAEPGLGCTRLLEQLALDTRIEGHVVLSLSSYRGDKAYGAAQALSHALLDALPREALAAARPYAGRLIHISADLSERLGPDVEPATLPTEAGEGRMRLQAALKDWFLSVAREQQLCILIDDLQNVDDESAAFLASLAEEAQRYRLLLVGTVRCQPVYSAALQSLQSRAQRVRLTVLTPEETRELLGSMFGDAPYLSRLADALHRISGGNPAHCLELTEHLVREHVIRYAEGMWLLPPELDVSALPRSREQGLMERLARLSGDGRRLAQLLAIHPGQLSQLLCLALSDLPTLASHLALAELVSAGVLVEAPEGYSFVHDGQRELLLAEISAQSERKRTAHLALGNAMRRAADGDHVRLVRAAVHLLHGGDTAQAGALLRPACMHFVVVDNSAFAAVTWCMEEAVRLLRAQGASDYQLLVPLSALSVAGMYVDRKLGLRHGDETMRILERTLRLGLARRLSRFVGGKLALVVALLIAGCGLALRRKQSLVPSLADAVLLVCYSASCLVGLHTMLIDPDTAARFTRVIEPLAAFGKDHVTSLNYEICRGFVETNRSRFGRLVQHWRALLPRLASSASIGALPENTRRHYEGGVLLAWGSKECWRDGPAALKLADRLDKLGMKLYEMSANQLRFMYYSYQGQSALAEHFRRRVDLAAIQRGSAWQVEIWTHGEATMLARRTHDTTACRRAADALDRLGVDVPSLKIEAARTRGCYLVLRGQYEEGRKFIEALPENDADRVGWTVVREMLARAYNGLGQHDRAREICQDALARLDSEDLTFTVSNLGIQIELCLAEAGAGNHTLAAAELDRLLVFHAPGEGALTLAALHEARARVALCAGDDVECRRQIERLEHWVRPTAISSLITRADRLERALAAKNRSIADLGLDAALMESDVHLVARVEQLLAVEAPAARASKALEIARELTGALQGGVFLGGQPAPTAWLGEPPSEPLLGWIQARLGLEAEHTDTDTGDSDVSPQDQNLTTLGRSQYRLSPLELVADDGGPIGVLVLGSASGAPRMPSPDVLRTIARALTEGPPRPASDDLALETSL